MTRWWGTLLGAGAAPDRSHGHAESNVGSPTPKRHRPSSEPLDDEPVDELDDAWEFEPEPQPIRRPGVDPLLARFGGLVVIITLAVPVVMGFTSGSDGDSVGIDPASAGTMLAVAPIAESISPTAPSSDTDAVATTPAATEPDATSPATTSPSTDAAPATETDSDTVTSAALESDVADTTPPVTAPSVTAPSCGNRYELAQGDYWIRIADAADVSLASLLEVNGASTGTVLVPGRSICLPVGASTPQPPPPPTTSPPTTSPAPRPVNTPRPAAVAPATTSPPTTAAPAPTTTAPRRPAAVSAAEAEAIIRSVWPDELEEHALEIAWRESNYRSNVNNSCCYGLFQIHWSAHRSWLGSFGITAASQLWDARLNAEAAYALYQRAGGFGPWGG